MKPFFSIVICTFNRRRLLPRAFDSLLRQTEKDFEVVVVDDGSNDQTADLVRSYAEVLHNLRYLKHDKNLGVGAARNTGVKNSIGDYVSFLDSDDEYEKNHLANRKELLQQDLSVQFLHGGIKVVGSPYVVDKDDYSKRIHIAECAVGGTFFIRKDVFDEIGGFANLPYAEDADFFERAVAAGITMFRTTETTYIYFRNVRGQLTDQHRKRCRSRFGLCSWMPELMGWLRPAIRFKIR